MTVYQVKRTYIARLGVDATMKTDRRTDYVEADSPSAAVQAFVRQTGAVMVGELAVFPDGTALGTCVRDRVTFVIRVASIGADEAARSRLQPTNFFRRSTDRKEPAV